VTATVDIPARTRFVYPLTGPITQGFPWVSGLLWVESQLTDRGRAELVVERVNAIDVNGVRRARVTGLIGARVTEP
jgi:hypothetical protein